MIYIQDKISLSYTMVRAHIRCAIMHERERERVPYRTYMRRTMVKLTYHICMHVDHLHREIFHVKCLEFRSLCDKCTYMIQ